MEVEKFVGLVTGVSGFETGCHEEVDLLVGESRRRIHGEKVLDVRGRASCFLFQLSQRARLRILVGIETTGRYFVQISVGRVPILANEEYLRIVGTRVAEKGHHSARAGMSDHLDLSHRSIREAHFVNIQRDDFSCVRAARSDAPGHASWIWTAPTPSSASGRLMSAASPTTTVCSSAGWMCIRAASNTDFTVTSRMLRR